MDLHTDRDAQLLSAGSSLVHIGPPETGTSSVQAALWLNREALRAQGVLLAGRTRNPATAVRAVAGLSSPLSEEQKTPSIIHWLDLARSVKGARDRRVVISSELFARAQPEVIRRVVRDLGPDRVHVAVTLRPLTSILSAQWQENVQAGNVRAYEPWLDDVFNHPTGDAATELWTLHRHDALIRRWAEVVGPDRVTAVVVDERDHGAVLRVFERLTGLREGTLVADRDLANRSLTLPEIEAIRALNEAFLAEGLGRALHAKVVWLGAAAHMKTRVPPPDEARIETPRWALQRAGEVAAEMVAGIAASGVRVVGDLDSLTAIPPGGLADGATQDYRITPEIAASLAMGVVLASGLARRGTQAARAGGSGADRAYAPRPWAEPPELARVSTGQLAGVLAARTRAALARNLRRG